ncbi:MAG: NAD(P)H-dependent oxidoreductase subunit E [Candidatus Aminicenantes bacterium]|nr:MAG: NAD(P)H-dependent oxidoreductase subunit E [Candidatus Aminicenantes bacterium]
MQPNKTQDKKIGASLVVGGGIGGMQAALDLAESGIKVYLVDNKPSIGGVMAQLDKTFPTNDCAMCTMAPRLVEVGRHKDIEVISLADIERITGTAGNFNISIIKRPRYVDEEKCTGCGICVENCPVSNIIYVTPERDKIEISVKDMEIMNKIIEEFKDSEGGLVPVLQKANDTYNYLPEPILKYTAEKLNIPLSVVCRIATFYNAFSLEPRGKHIITICLGTACHVKGAGRVIQAFEEKLGIKKGETTEDMRFTLEAVRCIGCCGLAPVLKVGEEIHGLMSKGKVPEVVEMYQGA